MRVPISCLLVCFLLAFAISATAQTPPFLLVADGEVQAWTSRADWNQDSIAVASRAATGWLAAEGYPLATVDSAVVDTSAVVTLYASRGRRLDVAEIRIEGATLFPEERLRALFDTRSGRPLRSDVLRADLDRLLDLYAEYGFGLAQVRVAGMGVVSNGSAPGLALTLRIEEGNTIFLRSIELGDDVRTRPAYAARLLGLSPGDPLTYFDPAEVQQRLERSTLFARVEPPELLVHPDGTATLRLDVQETPPGAFDVIVGLLPPEGTRRRASLVGTGHLLLRNLFGLGHRYELKLDRLPGRVSSVMAQASVPYVFGLPLRLEAGFKGTQQDSTFGSQQYRGAAAYGGEGREVLVTISREAIKPGVEGARIRRGQQRVARSSATFAGVGFRLEDVDAPLNPRSGYSVETLLERGSRRRSRTVEQEGEAVREHTAARQERLTFSARFYHPLAQQVVMAVGADGYALRSDAYEEGELFRIGGATTLRGYDEERFRARYAARGLAEIRLLLDRLSYAFLFFDAGYIDQPEAPGVSSLRGFYPGYGLGVQVSTGIGLVVATYAAAPESGLTAGRVHLGLSFGL